MLDDLSGIDQDDTDKSTNGVINLITAPVNKQMNKPKSPSRG